MRSIKAFCFVCYLVALLFGSVGGVASVQGEFGTQLANAAERWAGPNKPVYVVTQNHYTEGFTPDGPTARFGDWIMIEIYRPQPQPTNQKDIYIVGERYALFVGGESAGYVEVEKVTPLQCNSFAAVVSIDEAVGLTADTMALATSAEDVQPHPNVRREADDTERGYAIQLAMQEFRRRGVQDEFIKNIQIERLVITELDRSGSKNLIGFLSLKADGVQHEVFLIGEAGPQPVAELSRYHKTTDLEDGKDSENVRFVDQLDLDQDATDEVIVEVTGYESEGFWIYKRRNGLWNQVWVGGQGGC